MAFNNSTPQYKVTVFLHGTVIGQAYPSTFKRETSKGSGDWVDDGQGWDVNVEIPMADESKPRIISLRIPHKAEEGDVIEFPITTKLDIKADYKIKTGIVIHGKKKKDVKEAPKDATGNAQPPKA